MKISDKKKFIVRVIEILVIIVTIIVTPIAIKYATAVRGYEAVGGEYLLPIFALVIILIIETIYEASEESKKIKKWRKTEMELKDSILEKITSLYALLSKIDRYWTKAEITKSIKQYNSMELDVRVYTFLEEDGEDEKRLAYIVKEKINLMESTVEQDLNYLLEDVKKLVVSKEEEEAKCQTN